MEQLSFWIGDAVCGSAASAGFTSASSCYVSKSVRELGAGLLWAGASLGVAFVGAAVLVLMIRAEIRTTGRAPRFARVIAAAYGNYAIDGALVASVAVLGIIAVAS